MPALNSNAKFLVVRSAAGQRCGLPVELVLEAFRPLPVEPLGQAPAFVRGLVRSRGEAVPLVDLDALLGGAAGEAGRYVSLRVQGRRVLLAVAAVEGLRPLEEEAAGLPPLLAEGAPAVEALAALDQGLLLLLRGARLLPPEAA
jgi:purine-binding chemotaxis protein CheW